MTGSRLAHTASHGRRYSQPFRDDTGVSTPVSGRVPETTECPGDAANVPGPATPKRRGDEMQTRPPAPIVGNSRTPTSPGHAYAALCGLSAVEHPSRWQQARMRLLARYLLDAATSDRSV